MIPTGEAMKDSKEKGQEKQRIRPSAVQDVNTAEAPALRSRSRSRERNEYITAIRSRYGLTRPVCMFAFAQPVKAFL